LRANPSSIRMIWITPKFPLGTPDGARIATCSLVRQLAKREVAVDLICLVPKGEPAAELDAQSQLGVRHCRVLWRKGSKYFPFPRWSLPFTFRSFADPRLRQQLNHEILRLLDSSKPQERTYIVFDGLHTFAALQTDLKTLSKRCKGLVYRAHNVEAVLWEQCAARARTPWFRWFFRHQARLVSDFESRVSRQVSVIAPVSVEDGQKFEQLATRTRVSVTRIGIDFPEAHRIPAVDDKGPFELLFLGRLDWLPNRTGLQWFLKRVWPSLVKRRPQIVLNIAGAGDGRWLESFTELPGVKILGRVDDVEPLYLSAALCIAPLFQGSGTRVKIIESARYKRGVITTALGAEGTGLVPGTSYIRAETQVEWVSALESVTFAESRRIGTEAFHRIRQHFDGGVIAGELLQALAGSGGRL
jgi:polysaccharide biosynthesis protein PslH